MTIKTSIPNLKKIETLIQELGYVLRYEKGNFQSGYCIVRNRKVIIVNKFFDTEARINCLIDIITTTVFEPEYLSRLTEASLALFLQISD